MMGESNKCVFCGKNGRFIGRICTFPVWTCDECKTTFLNTLEEAKNTEAINFDVFLEILKKYSKK